VSLLVMRHRRTQSGRFPSGAVGLGPCAPPTGKDVEVRTIHVLTAEDGLVSAIWVVADDLGLLRQLDGVALADPR
jgi:predicted ester cyclase